jgi:hypothetical protein
MARLRGKVTHCRGKTHTQRDLLQCDAIDPQGFAKTTAESAREAVRTRMLAVAGPLTPSVGAAHHAGVPLLSADNVTLSVVLKRRPLEI